SGDEDDGGGAARGDDLGVDGRGDEKEQGGRSQSAHSKDLLLHLRPMRKAILSALLLTAATAVAQPEVIRAARVLDGRGHQYANAAVVVENGSIVRIDEHPKRADIDLGDRTLMPGGIDTHVHIGWHFDAKDGRSHDGEPDRGETPEQAALYATENAYATLMGGITTVQ